MADDLRANTVGLHVLMPCLNLLTATCSMMLFLLSPYQVVDPMDGASPTSCVTVLLLLVSVVGKDWYSSHINCAISSTMIGKKMLSCNSKTLPVSLSELSRLLTCWRSPRG